jgi:glyoxylate reductase
VTEPAGPTSRILVTVPLPEPGMSMLRDAGDVEVCGEQPSPARLREMLASGEYAVVVAQLTDKLDADTLAGARISGISNYAVGVDNVDVTAATERGIAVGNTPGVLTDATADIAMLLMLATRRRCVEGDTLVRSGGFTGWGPEFFLGHDVSGATLGLVGRGRIAQAVARRAKGFDMDVRYCTVRPGSSDGEHPMDEWATRTGFDDVVADSDIVSLHVPLAPETHHLVDGDVLRRMRRTAVVVNTARGPVVDETALVAALRDGVIGGAGLDVYEDEPRLAPGLAELPNVVLLPHVGSATHTVRAKMAEMAAANAVAMLRGERPPHAVAG